MLEKGRISNRQFIMMTVMFTIGSSVLVAPSLATLEANQDAWLSTLLAIGCGLLLAKLYGVLAEWHPGMTFAEYSEIILGKWFGKLVTLLFILGLLILTAILLREVGDFITTLIMVETPIQAVEIVFMLPIVMGVRLGLETFTRTSEMIFPCTILFFLFMVLFLMPEIKLENISPFLENGLSPVLRGGFRLLGLPFLEMVVFFMIAPYAANSDKIGKHLMIGTLMGGLILLIINLLTVTVLGADATARFNYPTYELAKEISVGNFIQRIEAVSGGIIFISLFVKIILCFYSTALSLAQTLHLNDYRILTLPLGMLVIVLSLIFFPNIVYFKMFVREAWTPLMLIWGLFLPALLVVVDKMKKGFGKRTRESARK